MKAPVSPHSLDIALSIATATVNSLQAEGVDTDEHELRLLLADMNADVESLLVCLLRAAEEADGDMEAIAARQNDLAARKARIARNREAFRDAARAIIEALPAVFPDGRYKGAEYSASVRPGSPRPIVIDEALLPEHCWRVTRAPDMAAIRQHIQNGPLPGVTLNNAPAIITIRSR